MPTVKAQRSQPTPVAERSRPMRTTVAHDEHPRAPFTFEAVVEQQQTSVAKLARRLLGWSASPADVDDVVQDVFLAVLKHLGRFRGDASVATWITRITINACRAHRRRRVMGLGLLRRWTTQAPSSHEPPACRDERDETNQRVRQAVGGLPNRYREVIVLRYLQEMDVDAIADVLQASRSAIEVRLHRARAMLKDELGTLMDEGR
jgi:RNA polymerase sigma-70 factor (ECF subfamily)